ncbi:RIB43A-like with coiled-coils protein 2 [Anoplophora glabripennis]|uniref:RIB43A-like with coiled-coils protein 2 n=1 Tax=Anoplophora glabripennis TaxID=217634 RepID=UPI0008755BAC|nr:RIB43A-like with coiled-coils protein 2 [Anoplophora glabripennis]
MLNFNLMTEKDRREAAAIEKRRLFEEERKKRIFNPRNRLIGVDTEVLQKQIVEKQQRESEEKKLVELFQEHLKKSDEIAVALDRKEKEERAKIQIEVDNYRKNYQRPEDRREFDLNDPNYIKKQLPARLHDDDPRLGLSSAQKFEGEDKQGEERAKIQRDEFRAWLDQQVMEKITTDKERKAAEDAYKAAVVARDQRAMELDRLEKECRKKLHLSCLMFNQALAEEKACEKMKRKSENLQDDMAEIYNCLTSDLLTENPEVAQSNLGAGRTIASLCKGMTAEQMKKLKEDQLAQIVEQKKRKELEARMNREMDDYINGMQRTIYLVDRELEIKQIERNKQIAEENKRLADEQKNHKKYLEKVVYSNVPTDDFYDQFNKSSR